MDSANSLIVTIGANIDKLREEVGNAHGVLDSFKEKAMEIGGILAGAFTVDKIVEFSSESYKVAAAYQSDMIRMEYATKGNVQSIKELKETAESLSRSSWFSGDDLIKQESRLAIMGRTTEQIKGVISAATQMSAALGIDLPSSVDALNKSLNGVGKALIALDPSFKGLTEDQLKKGEAIKLATEKYGDIAKKLDEGSEGATARHRKAVEDLSRSYGELLQPAIDGTYQLLALMMDAINSVAFGGEPARRKSTLEDLEKAVEIYNRFLEKQNKLGLSANELFERQMGMLTSLRRMAEDAGRSLTILSDGQRSMAFLKPQPVKYVDGRESGGKEEVLNLNTINGLQEKIKQLIEQRGTAEGYNLGRINDQIKAYQKMLKELMSATNVIPSNRIVESLSILPPDVKNKFIADTKDMFDKAKMQEQTFFSDISSNMANKMKAINAESKKAYQDRVQAAVDANEREQKANAMTADTMGNAFGNVLGSQQSLAQGLAQVSKQIISDFAKRAMAAGMAKEAESGPPLVSIALMAATAAAISSLFSSLGSSPSVSGGGGSGQSQVQRYADTGVKPYYANNPMAINLNATLQVSGQNLQSVIRQSNYMAKITGG